MNTFDSFEEKYFTYWLEEARQMELIDSWERWDQEKHIEMFPPNEEYKMRKASYTPDFKVVFNKKAEGLLYNLPKKSKGYFFYVNDDLECIIDVKGAYKSSKHISSITFPLVQKIIFHTQGIYIQKVIPLGVGNLFDKTWTPSKYLLTDKTNQIRKIKQNKVQTLKQFINAHTGL